MRIYKTSGDILTSFNTKSFKEQLIKAAGSSFICFDEPMSKHTTFEIGGPADYFVRVCSEQQLIDVLRVCKAACAPIYILGNGSDLLVSDAGLRGVVIHFGEDFSAVAIEGNILTAQAGATNKNVATAACLAGLSGYEFASGIPGSIGGAAIMNAGAYDGEFKDVAESVRCLTPDLEIVEIPAEQACWSYRHSMMSDKKYLVLSVKLCLHSSSTNEIQARIDELQQRREEKQPLDMPSAGSTFKRPQGYFAGPLIQESGMQGVSVGGAQVSTKHAGFVINTGNATAADVVGLIHKVQDAVFAHAGVHLEPEVRFWE